MIEEEDNFGSASNLLYNSGKPACETAARVLIQSSDLATNLIIWYASAMHFPSSTRQ